MSDGCSSDLAAAVAHSRESMLGRKPTPNGGNHVQKADCRSYAGTKTAIRLAQRSEYHPLRQPLSTTATRRHRRPGTRVCHPVGNDLFIAYAHHLHSTQDRKSVV